MSTSTKVETIFSVTEDGGQTHSKLTTTSSKILIFSSFIIFSTLSQIQLSRIGSNQTALLSTLPIQFILLLFVSTFMKKMEEEKKGAKLDFDSFMESRLIDAWQLIVGILSVVIGLLRLLEVRLIDEKLVLYNIEIYILPILLFFKYIVPKSSFTSNRYQLSAIAIVTLVFGIISVTLLPSIGKSIALPLIRVALEAIRMIILEKELTETEGIDFVISSTTVSLAISSVHLFTQFLLYPSPIPFHLSSTLPTFILYTFTSLFSNLSLFGVLYFFNQNSDLTAASSVLPRLLILISLAFTRHFSTVISKSSLILLIVGLSFSSVIVFGTDENLTSLLPEVLNPNKIRTGIQDIEGGEVELSEPLLAIKV